MSYIFLCVLVGVGAALAAYYKKEPLMHIISLSIIVAIGWPVVVGRFVADKLMEQAEINEGP